ncbi:MAG: hypothetical protein WC365_09615 [Candidatus Babeliales bacterium]
MSEREAMKTVIKFLFTKMVEMGFNFTREQINKATEIMHDDDAFLEGLLDYFKDHIDTYGENYDLPVIDE